MSETRKPTEVWKRYLPEKQGTKQGEICKHKIELFPAYFWAQDWEPGSKAFSPRPPLQTEARKAWWQHFYRIRVNGRFIEEKAGVMNFYTKAKIFNMYFNGGDDESTD